MKYLIYIAILGSIYSIMSFISARNSLEIKHSVRIMHKGISLTDSIDCILVEVQNKIGKPSEFYMDVESVVCGDSQCRIDLVRIYWDNIGRYKRLELAHGIELEKAEGNTFSSDDYIKLNTILEDPNSPLEDVYKNEIVGTLNSEGVDGLSGATILVEKIAYVEGAVWTCYSLWHWAHGETKEIIRNITGDSHSIVELQNLLTEKGHQKYAIEQLIRKRDFSNKTVEVIIEAIETTPALLKSSLAYWEITPNEVYTNTMSLLISSGNATNRLLCFKSLIDTKQLIGVDFFKNLKITLADYSYQEIDQFLNTIIKKGAEATIIHKLIPLLNGPDFLISRRVYLFLKDLDLTQSQTDEVIKFYNKWRSKI